MGVDGVNMAAHSVGTQIWEIGASISSGVASSFTAIGNKTGGILETMKTELSGGVWGFTASVSKGLVYLGEQLGNGAQFISETTVSGISSIFGSVGNLDILF